MYDPTFVAILRSWSFPPTIVVGLLLAAVLYGRGLLSDPQTDSVRAAVSRWRVAAFYSGLGALAFALMSPIAPLGGLLFSAHMVQHMVLAIVAAPLLVLGGPLAPMLRGLPAPLRNSFVRSFLPGRPLRQGWDWLTRPLIAASAHAVTIWVWHVPGIYDVTLRVDVVHYFQHATILATAILFWWPVAQPAAARALPYGVALLYLTAGMVVQHKLLGAILTFARQPLYPYYSQVPRLWGFSALSDQQTAGLIMSTGGFMIVWIAFTAVFIAWARDASRDETRGKLRQSRLPAHAPAVPGSLNGANRQLRGDRPDGRAAASHLQTPEGRSAG